MKSTMVSSIACEDDKPRISQALFTNNAKDFRSMATLPSNVEAIEAAMLFSTGLENLVAVIGPSGWGKSHLLTAAADRMRLEFGLSAVEVLNVDDWLSNSCRQAPFMPVILDDVQTCLSSSKVKQHLRLALERRAKAGRPTMLSFTASAMDRQIKSLLPQFRDWTVVPIKSPTCAERVLVVRQMCKSEGLTLSDSLVDLIAKKVNGNGRTYIGALKRLRLQQSIWLTVQEVLRACGVLNPFLSNNSSWDLREHIIRIVSAVLHNKNVHNCDAIEISAYLMLREAWLSEAQIADYVNTQPKTVYAMAAKVEQAIALNDEIRILLMRLISDIVDSLHDES
jgi:chromosomal replication initiation ATPase DnaA